MFDGNRAVGVEVGSGDDREELLGRRVTLGAGAFGTPSIMLRSGIGPVGDLQELGIDLRVPLAGVGGNLTEHCFVEVSWETPPGIVDGDSPFLQAVLRYTASGSPHDNDMQIIPFQELPRPALSMAARLMKPYSRGTLRLQSKDPIVQPDIRFNFASDPEDRRWLADGLKLLAKLAPTPALEATVADRFSLDEDETISAVRFTELAEDDDWVEGYIEESVCRFVHAVGTARMGPANDPGAVVHQHGRVHGVSGLRVADASIMPTIARANTNLTCIMIGERMPTWMSKET